VKFRELGDHIISLLHFSPNRIYHADANPNHHVIGCKPRRQGQIMLTSIPYLPSSDHDALMVLTYVWVSGT